MSEAWMTPLRAGLRWSARLRTVLNDAARGWPCLCPGNEDKRAEAGRLVHSDQRHCFTIAKCQRARKPFEMASANSVSSPPPSQDAIVDSDRVANARGTTLGQEHSLL